MSHPDTTSKDAVFQWRGIPQPGQLLPLGLQHVVAAVVGVITPAILIADTCGLSSADKTLMIQVSLILTALATLLQLFPIFHRIGSGLPAATYSQNVGIVTVNRVINRAVFALAALILLVAGLVPKFASLLTTIPQCVIGGATISVFATITMTGIRMITEGGFTPRKSSVVGLSVALGVGITQVSGCLAGEGFPAWVNTVFGSSSVVVAALMAILLNLILPKEPSANG